MFDGEQFDAVVYDLDGTLVDLPIDWSTVATEIIEIFDEYGCTPPTDFWDIGVNTADHPDAAIATLVAHERDAARVSKRLIPPDELTEIHPPVGVCSLNCETACRLALEAHGLIDGIDCIVGRDSVAARKPDPEPLLHTLRQLSATPADSLFVGDSVIDEETAIAAGTQFAYVGDIPPKIQIKT